jgi:uncharacterized membrane protein
MVYMLREIIVSSILLLVLDGIFLWFNRAMFQLQVADVQRVTMELKPLGAILCYPIIIFGLYYFILRHRRPVLDAMILGFIIYGVFETTNYALFKKWRLQTMMIDTLWGAVLYGLTTHLTYSLV